jgi:hypothetical protein
LSQAFTFSATLIILFLLVHKYKVSNFVVIENNMATAVTPLTVRPDHFQAARRSQTGCRPRLKAFIPSFWGVGGALVAILVVVRSGGPLYIDPGRGEFMLALVLSLPVVLFFTLAVHEGGHLLGAWLGGLVFRLVTVGPFRLAHEVRGLRFSFVANNGFQWQGNALCTLPTKLTAADSTAGLRFRLTLFLLGGPVATMGQTAVFLFVRHQLADTILPYWQVQLLFLLVYCPLAILPFTLLPLRFRGMVTDAAQLWNLWRYPQRLPRRFAVNRLTAVSLSGIRPRDWPEEALATLLQPVANAEETAVGYYLAFWQALDRQQALQAGRYLDEALALWAGQGRVPGIAFLLAAAIFSARFDEDTAVAQQWLNLIQPEKYNALAVEIEQLTWLAKATLWQQTGQLPEAHAAARRSQALLGRTIDKGFAMLAAEWLAEIFQAVEHVQPAAVLPTGTSLSNPHRQIQF